MAESGGEVVGYLHLEDYDVLYFPHMKNVLGIAVSGACRRQGVGRALLGYAEAWAKAQGQAGPAAGCARDQYPGDKAVRELRVPIYCYRGPGLWGIRAEMV